MPNQSDIDIDSLARRIVELSGNAGVTQRCVPLAAGGLDPDARVNYEFGLVLGVEEFRQEQFYHLQKEYLHNRGLHGYGVVSGLEISPERTADDDVRINVGTGVGVDQCGRTFTIRSDQCAYLRAWLERNRQRLSLTEGPLRLYVIGTYDECQDALVSIAGQPCASSEQSLAASRIRDSFNITLSATPPAMLAWEAIRRLAALMSLVRVVEELTPEKSEEAQIAARVRVLDDPAALAALGGPPEEVDGFFHPPYWLLPAQDLPQTLDRLFMIWVTEVRPRLAPAVIDGCGASDPVETGVLLGRLDLTLSDATSIQFDFGEEVAPAASHDDRPYLLQTQAIQELLSLGNGDIEQLPEVKVFAVPTIEVVDTTIFIRLWFPYYGPIALDETSLRVWDDSVDQEIDFRVEANENGDAHVWRLELLFPRDSEPEDPFAWTMERLRSAHLLFTFHGYLTSVEVDEQVSMSLIDAMMRAGYSYVGYDAQAQSVSVPYVPDLPDLPATVTEVMVFAVPTIEIEENTPLIRLWFLYGGPLNLEPPALRIQDDSDGSTINFRADRARDPHIWHVSLEFERDTEPDDLFIWTMNRLRSARLRFIFDVNQIAVDDGSGDELGIPLIDCITQGRYNYVGYYDNDRTITVPYVPDLPATDTDDGLTERDVLRIIEANRQPIPKVIPLADLRFLDSDQDNLAMFELWFHFDLNWELFNAQVEDEFTLFVFGEVMDGGPGLVQFNFERERFEERPNVFRIMVFSDGGFERLRYLRFIFPLEEGFKVEGDWGGAGSLREVAEQLGARFENTYDNEQFTGAPAVVLYGRVMDERGGRQ